MYNYLDIAYASNGVQKDSNFEKLDEYYHKAQKTFAKRIIENKDNKYTAEKIKEYEEALSYGVIHKDIYNEVNLKATLSRLEHVKKLGIGGIDKIWYGLKIPINDKKE